MIEDGYTDTLEIIKQDNKYFGEVYRKRGTI